MIYQYRRGVVPLSGDPFHFGHYNLVKRALELCEEVLVFIATNDKKLGNYLFSLQERKMITERVIQEHGLQRIRIIASNELLVDVYLREGCDALIRGVRNDEDRRFEETQIAYHKMILPSIADNVVYLEAVPEYAYISSSQIKAFVSHGIDVSPYVSIFVKELLEARINGQYKIGITGTIASGKTYVGERLAKLVHEQYNINATFISIDEIVREIYCGTFPAAVSLRLFLVDLFGREILTQDGNDVNRTLLAQCLFDPKCPDEIRWPVHKHTAPLVEMLYRKKIAGVHGLIIVEWAQLAETGIGSWFNNRVIVVESPDQARFAAERNISNNRLSELSQFQWSAEKKLQALETQVECDFHGTTIHYINRAELDNGNMNNSMSQLAHEVVSIFPIPQQPSTKGEYQ